MKIVLIKEGKPLYITNDLVCWWTVAKCLYKDTINPLHNKDFDEWRSKATIRGEKIETLLKNFNIKVWKWNEIARDWYLSE